MTTTIELNIIIFEQDDLWVAQCVEFDISARGKTIPALRVAFEKQVFANLHINEKMGRSGLDGIPPAPEEYRRLFEDTAVLVSLPKESGVRYGDVRLAA